MSKIDRWIEQDISTLTGKVAVITGANSGIGYEAAEILARKGAHVVLAVRNENKGVIAAREIRSRLPAADLDVMALDLSSLASIRAFADAFVTKNDRLDLSSTMPA